MSGEQRTKLILKPPYTLPTASCASPPDTHVHPDGVFPPQTKTPRLQSHPDKRWSGEPSGSPIILVFFYTIGRPSWEILTGLFKNNCVCCAVTQKRPSNDLE